MITRILYLILLVGSCIIGVHNHVGQPCKSSFIKVCLASNSYCDQENICRCKPDYPVNISLHSCRKGRKYSEKCEYTEECYYYDQNSYCTQLPYRSTCECHSGFLYNELKKSCITAGGENQKPANLAFPTAIGLSLAFATAICCSLVLWHVCKRRGITNAILARNRNTTRSNYLSTNRDSQRSNYEPSAPSMDEALPTYDTALSLKVTEDCEAPPSYDEVIGQEPNSKT